METLRWMKTCRGMERDGDAERGRKRNRGKERDGGGWRGMEMGGESEWCMRNAKRKGIEE